MDQAETHLGATNVAADTTPFVGRTDLLIELGDALESHRAVTLTGPAGVGKTRLAKELVLGEAGDLFRAEGGAWSVDLSEVRDRDGIASAVARALGLTDRASGPDPLASLAGAIVDLGPTLVILDGCERVVPVVSELVQSWLEAAPDAQFLAISREALRLPDEWLVQVPPLTVSGLEAPDPDSPALALLLASAKRFGGYEPRGADDLRALARVAARLDGLPLALELASKRLSLLGPRALLERLDDSAFAALGERGETLKAAIASSWDLLADDEKVVLSRCTVFRGMFSLEAAIAVAGASPVDASVVDILERLVEKSLVRARPDRRGFELLSSIREFAAESRDPTEDAATFERFSRYYEELGDEISRALRGPEPCEAIRRFHAEAASFAWLAEHDPSAWRALAAAITLAAIASSAGPIASTERTLARALGRCQETDDPALIARLTEGWLARSHLRLRMGAVEAAARDAERALELAGAVGAAVLAGRAHRLLAQGALATDDYESAMSHIEVALLVLQDESGPHFASALFSRSATEHAQGQMDAALRDARETLLIAERVDDARGQALALWSIILIALDRGERAQASIGLERLDDLCRRVGDQYLDAHRLALLGLNRHLDSDVTGAIGCYRDARQGFRRIGAQIGAVMCGLTLAVAEWELGELVTARRRMAEMSAEADVLGGVQVQALVRAFLSLMHSLAGDTESARLCLDVARSRVLHAKVEPAVRHLIDLADHAAHDATDARGPAPAALEPGHSLWSEMMLAHRLLERGTPSGVSSLPRLVVATDGSWFSLDDGAPVSLANRPTLMRLLLSLVHAQLERPGEPIHRPEIAAAVWPGERVMQRAVQNRIRVAIAKLRSLGLRESLGTSKGGYLLSADLRVELSDPDG